MDVRAAAAFAAGQPLQIETVQPDGRISIQPPIAHTLPLERINGAFDLMASGESIRTVVVF